MEKLLTSARAVVLDLADVSGEADDRVRSFCCALPRQCFINEYGLNEYVLAQTPEELERAANRPKRALLEALEMNIAIPPLWMAVIASAGAGKD